MRTKFFTAILLSLFFGTITTDTMINAANPKDSDGHELTSLWKEYEAAEKADRPLKQAEILETIKQEAKSKRLHWDFYDASRKKHDTELSRNWKLRDSLKTSLSEEIKAYGEPIVTFAASTEGYLSLPEDFTGSNKERLQSGHNPNLYFDGSVSASMSGQLKGFIKDDYEYVLWTAVFRKADEEGEAVSKLEEHLGSAYPNAPWLEYNKMLWTKKNSDEEAIKAAKDFAAEYSGKAISLYGKGLALQTAFNADDLDSDGYKRLYEEAKAIERERSSYKSGADGRIAKSYKIVKNLMEVMTDKDLRLSVEDGFIVVNFRNLSSAKVEMSLDEKGSKAFFKRTLMNASKSFYAFDSRSVEIPDCDDADYVITARSGDVERSITYSSRRLSIAVRESAEGLGFYVADYLSGRPEEKVDLELFRSGKSVAKASGVQIDGFTKLPETIESAMSGNRQLALVGSCKDENGFLKKSDSHYLWTSGGYSYDSEDGDFCEIFTDKSAYNPGETVRFKALLYSGNRNTSLRTAEAGQKVKAELFDSEQEVIDALTLETNDFGSVAGEFLIPEGRRNGMFGVRITFDDNVLRSKYIRVDDFILPSYDLTFSPDEKAWLSGDTVEVKAMLASYSGHSLAAASVSYEVFSRSGGSLVASGIPERGEDGSVSFTFPTDSKTNYYTVNVRVTDATGETLEFSRTVRTLSQFNIDLTLANEVDGQARREPRREWKRYGRIGLVNSAKASVRFGLSSYQSSGRIDAPVTYVLKDSKGNVVEQGTASNGETKEFALAKEGLYLLETKAVITEPSGEEKKAEAELGILRMSDGSSSFSAPLESAFMLASPSDCENMRNGDEIRVRFAAGDEPLWAVAELFGDKCQLLEKRMVQVPANSVEDLVYSYKESYPDALRLKVFYFHSGEDQCFDRSFSRPREIPELPLAFSTFEDKTLPGKEYSFSITTEPGVEAVAAVFDKSTETIAANNWAVIKLVPKDAASVDISATNGSSASSHMYKQMFMTRGKGDVVMAMAESASPNSSVMAMDSMVGFAASSESVEEESGEEVPDVALRSDFSSTLAFEPFLRSDDDGNIELKFKTSDKLSTFAVQVFAHTKDMKNSVIRKEMMVTVPVKLSVSEPQYLLKGDKFTLHATVSSNSSEPVSGKVYLQAYNTEDYESAKAFMTKSVKVTVPAGGAEEVEFSLDTKKVDDVLGLKLVFADNSKTFSDGVFTAVPVYEAVQTLTESHSAVLLAGMDKDAVIRSIRSAFTGTSSYGAEIKEIDIREMVLDALPSKAEPSGEDVISLTEALYVRRVAESLGAEIERVISDEELVRRILACANPDGGFGWFDGMSSSRIITAVVLERLAKMRDAGLGGIDGLDSAAAVKYLDRAQFIHDGSWPVWRGGLSLAQYAHVRSLFASVPFDVSAETKSEESQYSKNFKQFRKDVKDYLLPSEKDGRGLTGQILDKSRRIKTLLNLMENEGGQELAASWGVRFKASAFDASMKADIISLLEYAVEHKNGGWYYPNAVMPFRGLLESEAYAHSVICDLLSRQSVIDAVPDPSVPEPEKIADGIRLWLMLQKETQKWDEDPAFVDAINSVLSGPQSVLETRVVVMTKRYSSPIDKIAAAGNGFTISRKFFRETADEDGKVSLEEIASGTRVKVGDKIIAQYQIWNEENRSFVRLSAPREASLRPVEQLSGYMGWRFSPLPTGSAWYVSPQGYRSVGTDGTEFMFDVYPEEKSVITEEFFVTQEGTFSAPVVTIESLYAPHYRANGAFAGSLVSGD